MQSWHILDELLCCVYDSENYEELQESFCDHIYGVQLKKTQNGFACEVEIASGNVTLYFTCASYRGINRSTLNRIEYDRFMGRGKQNQLFIIPSAPADLMIGLLFEFYSGCVINAVEEYVFDTYGDDVQFCMAA